MNETEFVYRLNLAAPTREDFYQYELSDDYVSECIESYKCIEKENPTVLFTIENPIVRLLSLFDCKNVQIGNLKFLFKIVEREDYYEIGNVELDILTINKITFEIEVRDHDCITYIIWPVASNASKFLDAMIISASFFTSKIKDPLLQENDTFALEKVNECIDAAGGEIYGDFYKMLLGYFE